MTHTTFGRPVVLEFLVPLLGLKCYHGIFSDPEMLGFNFAN